MDQAIRYFKAIAVELETLGSVKTSYDKVQTNSRNVKTDVAKG